MYRQSKRLVTHVTFVRFLSTVNSAATHKATWLSKSFATNSSLHSNGFSPEWLCLCTARWLLVRQHLPQSVHLYSLVWIIICLSIGERRWKAFLALGALKWFFSPECIRSWIFKYRLRAKRLWQTLHQYGLGLSSCRRYCNDLVHPIVVWVVTIWSKVNTTAAGALMRDATKCRLYTGSPVYTAFAYIVPHPTAWSMFYGATHSYLAYMSHLIGV